MLLRVLVLNLATLACVTAKVHMPRRPHNLAWLFDMDKKSVENENEATVCENEDCQTIAKILKESMDDTVDPCDDFYNFACGNWAKNNPIPPDEDHWSFVEKADHNLNSQVLGLLDTDSDPNDLITIKLAKRYYRTCMDEEHREKAGLEPIITTLLRIGGWPMIMDQDEWIEEKYTWQSVDDYYASLTGKNAFFDIDTLSRYRSTKPQLWMSPGRLPAGSSRILSRGRENPEYYEPDYSDEGDSQEAGSIENNDVDQKNSTNADSAPSPREEYADLISQVGRAIAEASGFDVSDDVLTKDIEDMLIFMKNLHDMAVDPDGTRSISLSDLHEWYNGLKPSQGNGKIDWIGKLMLLLDNAAVEVDGDPKFILQSRAYFGELRSLLEETPSRVIVNYIHWRFISEMMDTTTKEMQILHKKIVNVDYKRSIPKNKKELSKKCIREVELSDIMSYIFVQKYFPDKMKEVAEDMIEFIQKEVGQQILKSEWLDEETKNVTLEKLHNMKKKIGYPNWYRNATLMKEFYKGLTVGTSYFENALSYSRFLQWKQLRTWKYGETEIPMEEQFLIPLMLNAMYAPTSNTMILTAADFQNPFYALKRPSIINFGIIGSIIGHEINHGFDDYGRKYDKNGKRIEWLSPMVDAYDDRVDCFVHQYNNYSTDNNSTKNYGRYTRNENIADTMGLEATLGGYYLSREGEANKPVEALPGLEKFTPEQIFFLSFANMFCEVMSPEAMAHYRYDVHSSGRLRAIGPISNSKSFAKSFNCPVGSPMNPEKKCNIWD